MPTHCSAPRCNHNSSQGYTFKFIPKEPQVRQHWINQSKVAWDPPKCGRLCEVHFDPSDVYRAHGAKWIKPHAIPVAFCACEAPARRKLYKSNENVAASSLGLQSGLDHVYSRPAESRRPLQQIQNFTSGERQPLPEHGYAAPLSKRVKRNSENNPVGQGDLIRQRWINFPHQPDCIVKREPLRQEDLQEWMTSPLVPSLNTSSPSPSQSTLSTSSSVLSSTSPPSPSTSTLAPSSSLSTIPLPSTPSPSSSVLSSTSPPSPSTSTLTSSSSLSTIPLPSTPPSASSPSPSPEVRELKRLLEDKEKTIRALQEQVLNDKDKTIKDLRDQLSQLEKGEKEAKQMVNTILGEDQQKALYYGTTRGSPWSDETVKKALSLRLACGTTGYKQVIQSGIPLPAVRTLQRKLQHIAFDPGVLDFMFEAMAVVVPHLPPRMKKCALVFDEMAIQTGVQFDRSTGKYIGYVTLGESRRELACKAILFQLVGIGKRWKAFVCYHFLPARGLHPELEEVIEEILRKSFHTGLEVEGMVCDMGNRGLLATMGYKPTKSERVFAVPNPACPERSLFLMPDPVHVFKSAKEMIMNNRIIRLPADVVSLYGLPTDVVDVSHIEWLDDFQNENCADLKFAPKLKTADLNPGHFKKMKVTTSTNVLNFKTASALDYLAQLGEGPPEIVVTAWFVRLLTAWFNLMTGRTLLHAFSFRNMKAYNEAIALIRLGIHVFDNMKVGSGDWKVNQTHVIVASECMLSLQDRFLNEEGFDFFLGGRVTQDNMENAFSNIRRGRPKPSALDFKFRLKSLCIVGQDGEISNASYAPDKVPSLIDFCLKMKKQQSRTESPRIQLPSLDECDELTVLMDRLVNYVSGYVIFKLVKARSIKCQECFRRLQDPGIDTAQQALSSYVAMCDYTPDALIRASGEVHALFSTIERVLWTARLELLSVEESTVPMLVEHFVSMLSHLPLSTCHDVRKKLIARFVKMRLPQLSTNITEDLSKRSKGSGERTTSQGSALASRTMGSGLWADNYRRSRT